MDKRNWPWKRKTSDRSVTSTESGDSSPPHPSRHSVDQIGSGYLAEDMRISDATMVQQHQSEEKINYLNERLLAADDLVKQHVKVAEEAVSGWEKSKAESISLKHQLDVVVEQKRATEDRVSHLDGALKECMRQLRHVREEQEQRIHEAIVKKTRDWDRLRSELEERLADADQRLQEAGQENSLFYKTVQEQAGTISELSQARAQAEAEAERLQVRIEAFEKENGSLKYEVFVLNKELEIRNQEREINKRSAEIASKQHQENAKKIAKLEAESQRLRILVRRKLPGPGALVQMKMEVEGLEKEKEEATRWRSGGTKMVGSPKLSSTADQQMLQKPENPLLSERLMTMEEETKMLKEALAKRNSELESARRQLDVLSHSPRLPRFPSPLTMHGRSLQSEASFSFSKEPSHASVSEDGDDDRSCADSWASALMSELSHFQKDKTSHKSNKLMDASSRLDSVDDFIEIERMASLSPTKQETHQLPTIKPDDKSTAKLELEISLAEQVLAKREGELQTANKLYQEVSNKLATAEEQLNLLRSKNATNELNLFSLQQRLSMIFEAREEGEDAEKILQDVKSALGAPCCTSVDGLQVHVRKLSQIPSPGGHVANGDTPTDTPRLSSSSQSSPLQKTSSPSTMGPKSCSNIGPELTSAICKVVRLVEDLALAAASAAACCSEESQHNPLPRMDSDSPRTIRPDVQPVEVNEAVKNFIAMSNEFLHGKVELVQFIAELSSILSQITKINFSQAHSSPKSRLKSSWGRPFPRAREREELSEADSPVSETSKSDSSGKAIAKVAPADETMLDTKDTRVQEIEEELRKIRAEKAALESHMRAEFSRMAGVEEMFAKLKQEKVELENALEEEKDKSENIKSQLHDAEQLVANLRVRLAASELSRNLGDERLSTLAATKEKLESQLKANESEIKHLHAKLEDLNDIIRKEQLTNEDLHTKCEALQQQLQKAGLFCSRCAIILEEPKVGKDQEIADAAKRLAECQQTILVLGKQLKELASPQEPTTVADPSQNQSAVLERMHSGGDQGASNRAPSSLDQNGHFSAVENTNGRVQRVKHRTPSDPGDNNVCDAIDEELISAAKGGHGSGRTISDVFGHKSPVHEDYIRAVAQMTSSPEADADKQLVAYTPKPSKKKGSRPFASVDLSKSLNLPSSSSPHKHGSSFSRFFFRNKNS